MSVQQQVKEESLVEIKRLKIEGENFFCISIMMRYDHFL